MSLTDLLRAGAALNPSAIAIDDGVTLTYDELMQCVGTAGAILRRMLPEPGSRVALCAANHADHLIAYLAILMYGYIWVPLNPANGKTRNSVLARKAQPELLLVDRGSAEHAPEWCRRLSLDELQTRAHAVAPLHAAATDVAAIKFTGGTSGEPKGVVQTHGNMLAVIDNLQAFYEFGPGDCNLAVAPLTHGSSHFVIPVLAAGGRHRFLRDRSPASILAAMRDGTTVTFMPPTLIYRLLQTPDLSPAQFRELRHLSYGAAPMPPSRIVEAQQAFGPCISTVYGLTEAPMTICALEADDMQDPELQNTVGKPCRNSRVRVVDDTGAEVSTGMIGNIEARGPIVMRGYLDEPELTEAAIADGWLRTGDLGRLDASGYLTLAGRSSEVIISGGFNVYPAEIENVLARVPGVRDSCVFGIDDCYWGERIEAAVVVDQDSALRQADILEYVRKEVGPVRTPKALHFVAALPKNAVGKVVRRELAGLIETKMEQNDVQSV